MGIDYKVDLSSYDFDCIKVNVYNLAGKQVYSTTLSTEVKELPPVVELLKDPKVILFILFLLLVIGIVIKRRTAYTI